MARGLVNMILKGVKNLGDKYRKLTWLTANYVSTHSTKHGLDPGLDPKLDSKLDSKNAYFP